MEQGFDEDHYHSVHLYEENQSFTIREKLAIEYAECFALDHKACLLYTSDAADE